MVYSLPDRKWGRRALGGNRFPVTCGRERIWVSAELIYLFYCHTYEVPLSRADLPVVRFHGLHPHVEQINRENVVRERCGEIGNEG